MPILLISGHILNKSYQEAKLIADDIVQADENNLQVEAKSMLEWQWSAAQQQTAVQSSSCSETHQCTARPLMHSILTRASSFPLCSRVLLRLSYLSTQKRLLGGKALEHDSTQPLIVHSTLGYIGGLEELILWALGSFPDLVDPREMAEYAAIEDELQTLADREFAAYIEAASASGQSEFAYLDFSSAALEASASGKATAGGAPSRPGTSAGSAAASRPATQQRGRKNSLGSEAGGAAGDYGPHRVIVELFTSMAPRTCANFLALCTGEKGEAVQPSSGRKFPLHYTGSFVHRIVKDGWIQAGDIVSGRGCDGWAALPLDAEHGTFPDENLSLTFDGAGLLAMANNGPHTNSSQFLITLRDLSAFNGKYSIFGRVIFGMGTLQLINSLPAKHNQRPITPLQIVQSDRFTASMLDDQVNKWTRKRVAPKRKKKTAPGSLPKAGLDSPRLATKAATILVVGFNASGKSTIVNNILGRPFEPTNPTVGFERNNVLLPPSAPGMHRPGSSSSHGPGAAAEAGHASPFQTQFYCLGGAENIRGYWQNYYDAVHGIIFVVDCSPSVSEAEWTALKAAWRELLNNPLIRGKPVLVFANKQDVKGALSMTEVSMRLGSGSAVESGAGAGSAAAAEAAPVHYTKCTARAASKASMQLMSPLSPAGAALNPEAADAAAASGGVNVGTPADVDPSIPRGLSWLLGRIEAVYQPLSERVAADVVEARRKAKEQMEASKAKIKKAREEREAREAAEEAAAAAKAGGQAAASM